MSGPEPNRLALRGSITPRFVAGRPGIVHDAPSILDLPSSTLAELWIRSDGAACELTREELFRVLLNVGNNFNFGLSANVYPSEQQQVSFLWHLRLSDLALAAACALGRAAAWKRFFLFYRARLTQAAIDIARSHDAGQDLADSLYTELYSFGAGKGAHRSPLASYSGRGSLLGWLRSTLAQRLVNHRRRLSQENLLNASEVPQPGPAQESQPAHLLDMKCAIAHLFRGLDPESRFLLASYFLDEGTPRQIAAVLHVDEATIRRRITRISVNLRGGLLAQLQATGLCTQVAVEAVRVHLGLDPHDLEQNLRWLLQSSQSSLFSVPTDRVQASLRDETLIEGTEIA